MQELLTTVLDLVGMLLLIAAAAVLVAAYSMPGALAVAGAGILGASWLVDRRQRRTRRPRSQR